MTVPSAACVNSPGDYAARCRRGIDAGSGLRHPAAISTITVAVPDPLDAALLERMKAVGAESREQYVLSLVEADCAASELERTLIERWDGPFAPLHSDWQEQVRQAAALRT